MPTYNQPSDHTIIVRLLSFLNSKELRENATSYHANLLLAYLGREVENEDRYFKSIENSLNLEKRIDLTEEYLNKIKDIREGLLKRYEVFKQDRESVLNDFFAALENIDLEHLDLAEKQNWLEALRPQEDEAWLVVAFLITFIAITVTFIWFMVSMSQQLVLAQAIILNLTLGPVVLACCVLLFDTCLKSYCPVDWYKSDYFTSYYPVESQAILELLEMNEINTNILQSKIASFPGNAMAVYGYIRFLKIFGGYGQDFDQDILDENTKKINTFVSKLEESIKVDKECIASEPPAPGV